ncbi:MAG: hypothetical protein BWY75_03704 [bacterium ADurb.Bin425]|nr:MAG: hypothetical protein BWY75_03704 [bacterium ADurb.Bin425]
MIGLSLLRLNCLDCLSGFSGSLLLLSLPLSVFSWALLQAFKLKAKNRPAVKEMAESLETLLVFIYLLLFIAQLYLVSYSSRLNTWSMAGLPSGKRL